MFVNLIALPTFDTFYTFSYTYSAARPSRSVNVECHFYHLDCYCIRVKIVDQGLLIPVQLCFKPVNRTCSNVSYMCRKSIKYTYRTPPKGSKAVEG